MVGITINYFKVTSGGLYYIFILYSYYILTAVNVKIILKLHQNYIARKRQSKKSNFITIKGRQSKIIK